MKKGFTIIELVVVIALIFILSAAIMNKVGSVIKNSKDAKAYFIAGEYRTVYKIAAVESEDGGNNIGFEDLVKRVDRQAANELYSNRNAESKGAYLSGDATGIGGYLEVGTNTGGITIEGGTAPLILLMLEDVNGVTIADNSTYATPGDFKTNGKDTRGEEWDGIK
ncbi:type II secretion system protein [uncultured Ilyobacter sp.]|uniref:type II secretion system protein n=1 Tax=uncultured Ilyobacter sp. TaxID=544433 RepID=UPI0029C711E6|nr:type II secretion system protein [uncultured Ilyobacter sp.]